jgi:hypothetical protein
MYENLPLYNCHKQVRAAKITGIDYPGTEPGYMILKFDTEIKLGEWFTSTTVGPDFVARCPAVEVGGYFVVYADGYTSYSPAKAFENGYELAEVYKDGVNIFEDKK